MMSHVVHHIPVCPFSQRLEILLSLKGQESQVRFEAVDITKPRDPRLLELSGGSTSLPIMEVANGKCLKESLVLLGYLEDLFPDSPVRRSDPWERAVENLLACKEAAFGASGYTLVMNQDAARRDELVTRYHEQHAALDAFLRGYSQGDGPWLFERFGWAECIFTPFFHRFAFVRYYEGVDIPETSDFARVRAWREACLNHPAAQQVSAEEVIKLYYDYSRNAGNGALPEGRRVSSFALSPNWQQRPWPPKDKYGTAATDEELGLRP